MKVFTAFTYIFSVFAFLTVGSLLIIVSLHILSFQDALIKIEEVYSSPMKSMQTGLIGLVFILIGLAFSKMLVKRGKEADALILQSEAGPIVVSLHAIEDAVKKVVKRFHLVKESKIKTIIRTKQVQIKLRLVLWSGGQIPELISEIQSEVKVRLSKLLNDECQLEVACDIQRIEDYEIAPDDPDRRDESGV